LNKPKARSYEQDLFGENSRRRDLRGKPIKEHRGKEVVREGICPKHNGFSDKFVGVNSNGWIFKCDGKGFSTASGESHYFINTPPADAP